MYTVFMHWGSLIVPPGYTDSSVDAAGGNPYGTSSLDREGGPDAAALAAAGHQGRRLAEKTAALLRGDLGRQHDQAPSHAANGGRGRRPYGCGAPEVVGAGPGGGGRRGDGCVGRTSSSIAREHGVERVYDDVEALVAVDIVVPPGQVLDIVQTVCARGKPVMCEKPLGVHGGEARAMLEAATAAGVVHALCHQGRCTTRSIAASVTWLPRASSVRRGFGEKWSVLAPREVFSGVRRFDGYEYRLTAAGKQRLTLQQWGDRPPVRRTAPAHLPTHLRRDLPAAAGLRDLPRARPPPRPAHPPRTPTTRRPVALP